MPGEARLHRRGSWADTRRELLQITWAVFLFDAIALGLGVIAACHVGTIAIKVGTLLVILVTASFALLVGGNLAVEAMVNRWITRRGRNQLWDDECPERDDQNRPGEHSLSDDA